MSDSNFSFEKKLRIPQNHPSLEGHFPKNPIVPGVVILDHIMRFWQEKTKQPIFQIGSTKFVQLLRADVNCTIIYKAVTEKNKIDFKMIDESQNIITKGVFFYD